MDDDNDDVGDGSRKRQNNTSKQQQPSHQRGVKRSKTTEVSPPENGKTLGDYFNERWFKSGLTDEQKEDFLLELKIKTLKRNSGFRQEAQKSLKIDLEHFLNTGNERLIDTSFSKVIFPDNKMGIKRLPEHADLAFANLIIDCVYENYLKTLKSKHYNRSSAEYCLQKYFQGKQWENEMDMLRDKKCWSETTYRECCVQLARRCTFVYRSKKTKELYRRTVLDMVVDTGLNDNNFAFGDEQIEQLNALGDEQIEQLNAKLVAFFFRLEQQKLTGTEQMSFNHSSADWNCCSDARLLETLLDPEWRALIQFAILPSGETLVGGTDQTVASTVWNTVICVLFNNKKEYKLKTRFPTDLDFWTFIPHHGNIRDRSAELLKGRLTALRSHFAKLFKNWKATADESFRTDLTEIAHVYDINQDRYEYQHSRAPSTVLNLTAMYMFEIWSQNQDDEFINQVFGLADGDTE